MSRATRRRSWLMSLAVAAAAVVAGPGAVEAQEGIPAPSKTVVVTDDSIIRQQHGGGPVVVNDIITYVLHDYATKKHSFTFSEVSPLDYELDPADPNKRSFAITFDKVGKFTYRCKITGLSGFVKVEERVATTAPPTTLTPARATTTTTARPAPSTTTTTTTARPAVTAPPSTSQQAVVSAPAKAATTSTAPTGAPTSPAVDPGTSDGEADEVAFDEATHQEERDGSGTIILIIAIGLGAALLGAGGWAWYHRPSRYLSA